MKTQSAVILAGILVVLSVNVVKASVQTDVQNHELQVLFLKRQVEQTLSVGMAIRSISSHYPREVMSFVDIALDEYPEKYNEIIFSAISSQPALTEEIVDLALQKDVASCPDVVEIAIKAEPSYVDFVVHAAANATPEELDEIVRVAVITEPDSADRIVQTLAKEHPSKMISIMTTAMDAVPFVGDYMVDALLTIFPNRAEDVVTNAVKESLNQSRELDKILEAAQNLGVSDKDIRRFAIEGGASDAQITRALTTPPIDY